MKKFFMGIVKFILFLLKQVFIFAFRIFLFILLIGLIAVSIQKYKRDEILKSSKKDFSYIEIEMNKKLVEGSGSPLFSIFGEENDYLSFIKILRDIEKDEKVKGLILNLDDYALTLVQTEEIGAVLKDMKGKKEVYAYATSFSRGNYLMASYADQIMMPNSNSATSQLYPYSTETPYYKRLADKVGVQFNVIHMGDYKSMGENYVNSQMSDFARNNMTELLEGVYKNFVKNVSNNRKLSTSEIEKNIEEGKYALASPFTLKEDKLIDETKFYHDFLNSIGREKVITLDEYRKIGEDLLSLRPQKTESNEKKIGIIFLANDIVEKPKQKAEMGIDPVTVEKIFNSAMLDESIAGVVLRVNSPGGSALASEIIQNMILNHPDRKKKPIYVSMGSVAASGGYYISTAADKIYLNENTITGSIGVVSVIPNVSPVADKIGVDINVIEKGKNSNVYSVLQPMTDEKIKAISDSSQKIYDEFKSRVSVSRKIPFEEVEDLAGGRVWLGQSAVNRKLADGIATLEQTVAILAKDLGLEKYTYIQVDNPDKKAEVLDYLRFINKISVVENLIKLIYPEIQFIPESVQNQIFIEKEMLYKPLFYYHEKDIVGY